VLHLCPTLLLSNIQDAYKQCPESDANVTTSSTVASHAWLNAFLTNTFMRFNSFDQSANAAHLPIVHLHQDVWNRSPSIVQSRLRSKAGFSSHRIYARKTTARRVTKLEYLPFLEENHLWGATGAKCAYGLYCKSKLNGCDVEELVAVTTFSSKRKVCRAGHDYHSYELLRFCTKLDTTIVGGLTKLISAFVKDVPNKGNDANVGIDIITSIDRDFGSNTWPNFHTVDIMDPVPMFVGEDGIRRHAVGAGLLPLDQKEYEDNKTRRTSELLRAGLPTHLLDRMNQSETPWDDAAAEGFHPVFDAGVERLLNVVSEPLTMQHGADVSDDGHVTVEELWEQSIPRFVTEHYSPNASVELMLRCIQENRLLF
jgi:hypothetical protein